MKQKTSAPQGKKTEPVSRTSTDIRAERIHQLRTLFPEAVTEGKVDFERLRSTLGGFVDDSKERYSFAWAGKQSAIRILQTPSRATLVPAPKESENFDETGNIFIEGDNLEVLKLLYKSYFGRVKMVYIDPPYNTGNDFIYPDNFADPLDTYLKLTGQKDSEGNLLTSNPETSGRYHSAWLTMMHPRLFLARQLLHEDGVFFVSINEIELANLRLMLDGIFGEENFIGTFIWKSRHNVDSRNKTGASVDHEYVVCYGRGIQGQGIDRDKYANPDNDPRGPWMSDNLVGLATKEKRPNLHYDLIDPKTKINYSCPEMGWRYEPDTIAKKISEGRILWPKSPDGRPRHKKFLADLRSEFTGFSTLLDVPNTSAGTQEVRELFGAPLIEFPKPVGLIKTLVTQVARGNDIVMDFFSGSATTAQAVMELNREDGDSRRFIMIQLPEPTPDDSPARKGGFKTIAEIGKERIRRVIKKLKKDDEGKLALKTRETPEDLGFRVFKLAESSYKPWTGVEEKEPQAHLKAMDHFTDPLVPGWKPEKLIWEVAVKEGYGLNSRVEQVRDLKGNTVLAVTDPDKQQTFRICLDGQIKKETLKALDLGKDDLFICRDAALDDEAAANLALQCRLKTI